ncbi:MAG: hypothetical protein JWS12_487 [Candidatus Saccharibacteria bacterium]|nr:hypothetical protein [Candidatus Saccharibacteria bacterium]
MLAQYAPANIHEAYTLERMQSLMQLLGNPQDSLRVIHIAGTSGKTSTAYFVAAQLVAAGKKVGLTVSPHIDQVNERVQLNLTPLSEREFCRELGTFLELIKPLKPEPTYFEILVALAYWVFAKHKVDYAVVEVGLGGLLDGTNVVSREDKICVITDIGLDHTHVLGTSLPEIAAQKAGIIGQHNHVFSFHQNDEVMQTLRVQADNHQAELHVVPTLPPKPDKALDLLPIFQRHNWELAAAVYDYVRKRDNLPKLTPEQLDATSKTYIPARMEIISRGEKTIVLDGAHNAQKMQTLATSMKARFLDNTVATLLAIVDSPSFEARTDLRPILNLSNRIFVTSFGDSSEDYIKHAVDPSLIAEHCRSLGFKDITVISDPVAAFETLLQAPEPVLLVTGSLYLMGQVHQLLKRDGA